MTHADQFRQMDDWALARYIGGRILDCSPTCKRERRKCENCTKEFSIEQWYIYLTSEVKEKAKEPPKEEETTNESETETEHGQCGA